MFVRTIVWLALDGGSRWRCDGDKVGVVLVDVALNAIASR